MSSRLCSLLSLAPYRILPATTGGHWGIVSMHNALGKLCQDHVAGTTDNGPEDACSFMLHRVFPPSPKRYLPGFGLAALSGIARRYDVTHLFCDHPYMAPTAIALSRNLGIPWFLRAHNIEALRFQQLGKPWWRLLHAYEGFAMRRANGIFFISAEDRNEGIKRYKLRPDVCHIAPYGTTLDKPPERLHAKETVAQQLHLDTNIPWLYFIGVQSYKPNADAVSWIAEEIAPRLQKAGFKCHILIGGKGLPERIQSAIRSTNGLVQYTGFIDNLDTFLKGCDVMLNPVLAGGGIKTKAVEALGYNKMVVSTVHGAAGIDPAVCGANLLITPDADWDAFAAGCIKAAQQKPDIPPAFYGRYNWDAIAGHVISVMSEAR